MNSAAPPDGTIEVGLVPSAGKRTIADLEALPIDSLWAGGHVASRNPSPETMMGLARLAALTERVRIGTSILLLPLYPPALIAKQIADLDNATGGRLVLGIGVGGEYPQEFRACQVPINERGRRTNEMIPLIRRLWTGEAINHDGRYYAMEDVRIHPPPAQKGGPPIVVAGRSDAAMRRAATLGDGWFPYLYSPRRYAASVATVRSAAAEEGRSLVAFGWYVWVFVNIDSDSNTAREQAARSMGGTYDQDFRPMVDTVAAAGTVDEVLEKLKAFHDAGARHFVFCPATAGADPAPTIDRLLGDVVPVLREYASAPRA
ncbi:MAG TPA: LLM class flavin-dependent oxidoreductase [Acidimicrobiales bacterium]|nr:LLM class flavin-dependent oxidoreductase [Acidimicrobiales bacterium]